VTPADGPDPAGRDASEPATLDVAVIGGGQAGLAVGHLLAAQGRRFAIYEASDAVGSAWRERWESLVLFTPRRYDALPGMPFPGDPDGYPTRDEVIAYLESYARRFAMPVVTGRRVRALRPRAGGGFVLEFADGSAEADQVVVATGPFQAPYTPPVGADVAPEIVQMHSTAYRRPADVPAGHVLVVGGGNTGFQIAKELAPTHRVTLAVGSRQTPLPQRLLGKDLFWWLTRIGLLHKDVDSRIGRRARGRDTLIGSSPREARRLGIGVRPRVVAAAGREVRFADGAVATPDAIVWATGYRSDHSWIDLPVLDERGRLRHRRGVTEVPGLYFLGLTWQHTRGSALLGFVEDDARFIAARVGEHAPTPSHAAAPEVASHPEVRE
jgi:putative flavoprotein involved in K+ transport